MIDAAAHYLAAATRCQEAWDASFRQSDEGHRLTNRDLMEMHGAGLALMWTTHTNDLPSALARLRQVEAISGAVGPDVPDHVHDHAKRVLEDHYW
jgi:hypothetical protein